ncbi:MAG: hypothetical protein M0C28_39145 [Candidatus Moduliflexus flocculans]|nr:hypothetical protein [Candidatus Moduliflexus flocculans]
MLSGVRVLAPLTVERMTEIYPEVRGVRPGPRLGPRDGLRHRAAATSSARGPTAIPATPGPRSGSIPETRTSVVFLTNRVHPDDKGDIIALRSKVANVVAAAILAK